MLTISAKGAYGLTAILELGINYNRRPLQIRAIARAHAIPQHYLEQLLVGLKKAGLVKSFRGVQGGYALAKHPGQIKVMDALSCLEGALEIVAPQHRESALDFFWAGIEKKIQAVFDMSLEQLIMQKQEFEKQISYSI